MAGAPRDFMRGKGGNSRVKVERGTESKKSAPEYSAAKREAHEPRSNTHEMRSTSKTAP